MKTISSPASFHPVGTRHPDLETLSKIVLSNSQSRSGSVGGDYAYGEYVHGATSYEFIPISPSTNADRSWSIPSCCDVDTEETIDLTDSIEDDDLITDLEDNVSDSDTF